MRRDSDGTTVGAGHEQVEARCNRDTLCWEDLMPKAAQVLAALKRDGWSEVRRRGSHRQMEKGGVYRTWAYHDGMDLGNVQMAQIAKRFGYSLDELRKL